MKFTLTARALTTIALGAATLFPSAAALAIDSGTSGGSDATADRALATYEGRTIDLAGNWGTATACHLDEAGDITCYRSEAEMDRATGYTAESAQANRAHGASAVNCSSSAKLYRNKYYGGTVLYISQRYSWINLSWFGFDNTLSSYKIGACYTTLRSGSGGSGSSYGGGTYAWATRYSMGSWDNVASSIRIS